MYRWRWPFIIFVSTVAIRLIGLGGESLWYDEAFSATLARLPLQQMIHATAGDVHPPLWYLTLWGFTHVFGYSEFWLRFPAAMFSGLAAVELYLVVKQTKDHRAGVVASGFYIASAGMQYYAQEARMYSMLTWLVFLSLRSIQDNNRLRFIPALALSMYSQNLSAVYVAPLAALAIWKWRKQSMLPLALAGASYLPWLGVLVRQISDISSGGYWIVPDHIGGVFYYWLYGTFGNRLPGWSQLHMVFAAIGLTFASIFALRKDFKKHIPLLVMALVPAAELFTISQLWQPMLLPRALLPASAGILGVWGSGMVQMPKPSRYASIAIAGTMLLIGLGNYYLDPTVRRLPAREDAELIAAHYQPGDALYHMNSGTAITYAYYLSDIPYYITPATQTLRHGLTDRTKAAIGLDQHESNVESIEKAYRRLWLFRVVGPAISAEEIAAGDHILAKYPVIDEWLIAESEWFGMTIYLLDLEPRYGMAK
jgi:4-amino-4-deoxy-L-arabinose transferase-like glycosyltransferase